MLGKFAVRIFSTVANSVSSECSFSVQNALHTKCRNSLHSTRVNKLIYLYTNIRIIRQMENGKTKTSSSSYLLSDKEEVELENMLLQDELLEVDEEIEEIEK